MPDGPTIVPSQWNRLLSLSGNAEIPGVEDIMSVINSLCSRFVTLCESVGIVFACSFLEVGTGFWFCTVDMIVGKW